MPELPEVENVRRHLLPLIKDQKIVNVVVYKKRIVQGDVEQFIAQLRNRVFKDLTRVGKYLIFHFDNNLVMISHLRMEGKYLELLADESETRYARVVFYLADGRRICYDDSRQFGTMHLSTEANYQKEKELEKLGVEPFNANLDDVYRLFKKTSKPIKEVLLDQTILTGLGNIYVDETLFASRIHPLTPANQLNKTQTKTLLNHSIEVLNKAIIAGGSTVRSYHAGRNQTGSFQDQLFVYGRAGEQCQVCGHLLKKIRVGGRGTTYCPYCQVNPATPLVIGITGPIASGKSTLLSLLKNDGYQTVSSDQIVHQLYQLSAVIDELVKIFGPTILNPQGGVNRKIISLFINEVPQMKKQLEKLIHPLVKQEIAKIIAKTQANTTLFVEVPLLYEARFEDLFQYVIGVAVSPERQLRLLEKRGDNIDNALNFIAKSRFSRYINRLDLLIFNQGDEQDLINKMRDFLAHLKK
ncbi:MAG: DNA-formamidopyrimidine glycosylase [Bacilli bacterium]|jgi:DNA-formamidopyrimidine glycosylase/dephospho-CoA kinase|nr:DNA-formamidopyrimidine glycosylase [Bacilli bacterium]MDD4344579.1 DNA-formamidopyrimidine glycosylase [Bacilli bacterium]MDD4520473.1 DNA-formamidopyrimidine glycosylase [Bacilli bacterium]